MGLFALGEFDFLFVQVDAVRGILLFDLGVFVREFHAEQVFGHGRLWRLSWHH